MSDTVAQAGAVAVAPKKKAPSRSRGWVVVQNNWTDADYAAFQLVECEYAVIGKEVGDNGTPHLQCYFYFKNAKTFNGVLSLFTTCHPHIEVAHGTPAQNLTYCSEDGDFITLGTLPEQGKRSDLKRCLDDVKGGMRARRDLLETHTTVMARYPDFVQQLLTEYAPRPAIPDITLRPWQAQLVEEFKLDAPERKVIFIVDQVGAGGKTTFAKYIFACFKNVEIMHPGRFQDMAYSVDSESRIVLLDCPRSQLEFLQYQFLEALKDGLVFCTKYQSRTKVFARTPHVIVFCNEMPDQTKLSADRYDIRVI